MSERKRPYNIKVSELSTCHCLVSLPPAADCFEIEHQKVKLRCETIFNGP